jgi:hypothetical protein
LRSIERSITEAQAGRRRTLAPRAGGLGTQSGSAMTTHRRRLVLGIERRA